MNKNDAGQADFKGDFSGIGRLLQSEMIRAALTARAELVKAEAERSAPVGDDTDPHSGRYRDSFKIRSSIVRSARGGRRAESVVYNDSPEAIFVEKGTASQDGRHILLGALQVLRKR